MPTVLFSLNRPYMIFHNLSTKNSLKIHFFFFKYFLSVLKL